MKKNMGRIDRIIRIVLGLAVIGIGIAMQSWWGLLGLIFLITSFMNYCPIYTLFGMKTCKEC